MIIKNPIAKFIEHLEITYFRYSFRKKGFRKTDLVGYETLIEFIIDKNILSLEGDFVEIGTFLGGGALKLSQFLKKHSAVKSLYVIDVFDLDFDHLKDEVREMYEYAEVLGRAYSNHLDKIKGEYRKMQTLREFYRMDPNSKVRYIRHDIGVSLN